MPTKQIYVTDDLFFKLQNVENVSGLISNLLNDHFSKVIKPDLKEVSQTLEKVEEERNKLLAVKKEIVKEERKIEKFEEKKEKSRRELIIEKLSKNYPDGIVPEKVIQENIEFLENCEKKTKGIIAQNG